MYQFLRPKSHGGLAHARIGGPVGNRGNSESREQTIENGALEHSLILV